MPAPALGPFLLDRPIARGGMGVVWRAIHPAHGVHVAVKLVDAGSPAHADALAREAAAIARLDHPGIVWIHDLGTAPAGLPGIAAGAPWIAMELARGTLADAPPTDWPGLLDLLAALLAALAHAHARGVVHRDVKPSNVLVGTDRPGPKLADFGLHARPGEPSAGGTSAWRAPEAWGGAVGPEADVYALGALAFALAAGARPFPEADPEALAAAHRSRPPPPLRPRFPVPAGFEAWVAARLAKDPAARGTAALASLELRALGPAPAGGARRAAVPDDATRDDATRDDATRDAGPAGAPPAAPRGSALPPPRAAAAPFPPRRETPARLTPALTGTHPGLAALRRPSTVGRERERSWLWARVAGWAGGAVPLAVTLRGPDGVGRRHLARWLAEEVAELGVAPVRVEPDRVVLLGEAPLVVALEDTAGADVLELGPLTDLEIAELADRVLPLERALRARLVAHARGLPGRALSTLRGWAAAGLLTPSVDGARWLGPPAPAPADVADRLRRARERIVAGDVLGAELLLDPIRAARPTGREAARLLAEEAQLASVLGRRDEQAELARRCLALTEGTGWAEEEVVARLMLARAALAAGQLDEARALAVAAGARATAAGVPGAQLAASLAAGVSMRLGDRAAAVAIVRAALPSASDHDGLPHHLLLVQVARLEQRWTDARAHLADARAVAARSGSPLASAHVATEAGATELDAGRPEAARALLAEALVLLSRTGRRGAATEVLLGEAELRLGQEGEAGARAARVLASEHGRPGPCRSAAALLLVAVRAATDDDDALREALAAWDPAQVGDPPDPLFARLAALAVERAGPRRAALAHLVASR